MAHAKIGAERNQHQEEDVHYILDPDTTPPDWEVNDVRPLASVATTVGGNVTLGVPVGPAPVSQNQHL